jgi:hypothetical protein
MGKSSTLHMLCRYVFDGPAGALLSGQWQHHILRSTREDADLVDEAKRCELRVAGVRLFPVKLKFMNRRMGSGLQPQAYSNSYDHAVQAAGQLTKALHHRVSGNKEQLVIVDMPFTREAFATVIEGGTHRAEQRGTMR